MIILVGGLLVPTPPHHKWRLRNPNGMAFPVIGRSHGLAAVAPGHGQVALGAKPNRIVIAGWPHPWSDCMIAVGI